MIVKREAIYHGLIFRRILLNLKVYITSCQQTKCSRGTIFKYDGKKDIICFSENDSICRECCAIRRKLCKSILYPKYAYVFKLENKNYVNKEKSGCR
jgi:hypothetical protein